ncbi:MAG: T9SS type A sorting domain-containing protein [Ignavibacteria bacterium]|nr:T9SS type A sorting domain-containing protein [Ignavibacteria bacterium]
MKNTISKLTKLLIIAAVALLFISASIANAALDSKGTNFWLMFDVNHTGNPTLSLFITSDVNTSGVVDIPGLAYNAPFTVTANTVTTVSIPVAASNHTSDVVDYKGIHVTSLQEVTVYGLNRYQYTTDAFLGLPVDILGTDYIVLTYKNTNIVNGTEFGIVGTVNGTTVTITPSETTGPRIAGVPYNITLNEGETYELRNSNNAPADLTGTKITSDQPIGVTGAHQCANIPNGTTYACDHICEMLPPTSAWGKNFVTVPLKTRLNGDTWRFMASQNATTVTINGVPQAPINEGQYVEQILSAYSVISSDKPILVAQYSNGTTFDGVTSDPFMMLVPPYEQFLANYTVTTPASGFIGNYINVVAPNAVVGALTLDGVPVPVVDFTPIGVSGFSGAQLTVGLGSHTVAATLPFGLFDYGFDDADSYGYPGGQALSQIAIVSSLDVTPEIATNIVGTQHCVDGLVKDQNGIPLVGIRVDYLISGANAGAGFAFTNTSGIAQYCYTGVNIGYDTIIGSSGSLSDTVLKIWQSALPVDLSSFTYNTVKNDVILKWITAGELNNSGFDIERSAVNNSWIKAGYVAGNGTTNEPKTYEFRDRDLKSGVYNFRLKQIDFNGQYKYYNLSNSVEIGIPDKFALSQNYPNPFNPKTIIDFQLPENGNVKLSVYDINGKIVSVLINQFMPAGYYSAAFNSSGISSGVYFYRLESGGLSKVMKMTVIK